MTPAPALLDLLLLAPVAVPAATALAANSVATLALTVGCIAFGAFADRIGATRALAIGCIALFVAVLALYAGVARDPRQLDVLYAAAGFCVGVVGVIPTLLVQAFPPAIRYSGISFAYNVAYAVFGGLTPQFVTALVRHSPMAPAYYVAALCLMVGSIAMLGRARVPAISFATHGDLN